MSRVLGLITNVLNWWMSTFTKQNLIGKLIFGSVSLCIACFLCGLPMRVISPNPTPQAPVSQLTENDPTATTEQATATTKPPTATTEPATATTKPPTATAEPPAATTEPPTATVEDFPTKTSVIEAGSVESGGLGLARSEWEVGHTPQDPTHYAPLWTGYDGLYDVAFQEEMVWLIDAQWAEPLTVDEVETLSQVLIPADSQLIETYSPEGRPETTVHLYMSDFLKGQFAGEVWIGGEPGNFTVQYNVFDGGVGRLVVTTGNNYLKAGSSAEALPPPPEAPTDTPIPPTETPIPATATPTAPSGPVLTIVAVNKRDEFVDIQNIGDAPQDLGGWHLLSERGAQDCPLGGVIGPGETLRIWAMAEDAGQGGFNCGFGTTIWNNSESDAAVLFDAVGAEVSRR